MEGNNRVRYRIYYLYRLKYNSTKAPKGATMPTNDCVETTELPLQVT
jgi:hypothetical protein